MPHHRKQPKVYDNQGAKARATMRALMAKGFTDEATLVAAAADALGGDETAGLIAMMVFRKDFAIMGAN